MNLLEGAEQGVPHITYFNCPEGVGRRLGEMTRMETGEVSEKRLSAAVWVRDNGGWFSMVIVEVGEVASY